MPEHPVGAPCILSCSPRANGNSDAAAALFARGYARQTGLAESPPVTRLRDFPVSGCVGCGACSGQEPGDLIEEARSPGRILWRCPLSPYDSSIPALSRLASASSVCILSPVYFYHLPAALKALIDRTQPFWDGRSPVGASFGRPKPCAVVLIAGRKKGEHLFSGSLLTLKYAFEAMGFFLLEPLTLRGYDHPDSLDPEARALIENYGRESARRQADPSPRQGFSAGEQP